MAYTESDTRAKLDPQIKSSDWLESHTKKIYNNKVRKFLGFILELYERDGVKVMGSDKLSSLIKLSGFDRTELKEAFEGAANIREGYFGLQREIYR